MKGMQMSVLGYIDRKAENEVIGQRITDGYVNATAMCKAANKQWKDYLRLSTTKPFLDELSSVVGVAHHALIQSIRLSDAGGRNPGLQGTWVHPQVAVHLAQWLSPKFAVLVTQWVTEWMSGAPTSRSIPYHLRRYMANMHRVPYGFFSMLNEVTLHLFGPLEQMGYDVASSHLPDISVGRTFSDHLRKLGHPVDEFPKYPHHYEDGRIVSARAYPNELLPILRKFFIEEWLKDRSERYFTERDPKALPYLREFLALPNFKAAMGYIEASE